jgi:hypothetical protein
MFQTNNDCSRNEPLGKRIEQLEILRRTLTQDYLEYELANLPPTPPAVYRQLSLHRETANNFKVLYLVQGDYYSKLPAHYKEQMTDLLFLSYKEQQSGKIISFTLF